LRKRVVVSWMARSCKAEQYLDKKSETDKYTCFCRYLAGENILKYDTYSQIQQINKKPVVKKTLKDFLSVSNIKLILNMPDISKKTGIRDRFYIALLYDSGCRDQEILDLQLSDIQLDGDVSYLNIVGKGTEFRVTPLSKEITSVFKHYVSIFHPENIPNNFLFFTTRKGITGKMSPDNVARFLNAYEKAARIVSPTLLHLHPHLFRQYVECLYMGSVWQKYQF
jgi:integrase/recombinase XerD